MISRTQKDAAQPHAISSQGKRDDLARSVGEVLIAARPARLQNEGLVPRLPLADEVLPEAVPHGTLDVSVIDGTNVALLKRRMAQLVGDRGGS